MTWNVWQVAPFFTSIFFILGVFTLYQVLFDGFKSVIVVKSININLGTFKSWFGVLYMLIFIFSMQATIVGKSISWEFMNFQIIALIFCAFFLNIRVPYRFFVPIVLVYMIFNSSIGYWESWCHAITLMSFYMTLNYIRRRPNNRYPFLNYLIDGVIFGFLLWFFVKIKFNLPMVTFLEEFSYLVIFEVLLYSYIAMLLRDSELKMHLVEFANHDALTQTENYAAFNSSLKFLFSQSQKHGSDLTMMMFDIDHFKKVNDTYGHLAGDEVLKHVVDVVQTVIDENDVNVKLYRTGGEEFNVVFPGYEMSSTENIVKEMFSALNHLSVNVGDKEIFITVSMGVSQISKDDQIPMDFYKRVDNELYHSKKNGRMQISVE